MKLRILALILAVLMTLSLAACFSSGMREHEYKETEPPAGTLDFAAAYAKFDPDELAMTIDGIEVYWDEYFFFLFSTITDQLGDTVSNWDYLLDDDYTIEQYIIENAISVLTLYNVALANIIHSGVSLSDEDWQTLDDDWMASVESYVENMSVTDYSGMSAEESFPLKEAELLEYYKTVFLTKELQYKFRSVDILYSKLYERQFGEHAEKLSNTETLAFAEKEGFLAAKHILFLTKDMSTDQDYDEAKIASQKQLAEETLAELLSAEPEELEAKFDKLMNARSEDNGLAYNPDGYCFTFDDMVPEFSEATKALSPGEMTAELVKSDFGYHIILRLAVTPDMEPARANGATIRELLGQSRIADLINKWVEAASSVISPAFQSLSLKALFER